MGIFARMFGRWLFLDPPARVVARDAGAAPAPRGRAGPSEERWPPPGHKSPSSVGLATTPPEVFEEHQATAPADGVEDVLDRLCEPGEAPDESFPGDLLGGSVDELFADLLDRGGRAEVPSSAPEAFSEELAEPESAEMREMFDGIAAGYVRPVRQFLARLRAGPASSEWLGICLPAVGMLTRSAGSMGLESLSPALGGFESLLRWASDGEATAVDGEVRDEILRAGAELSAVLPLAFAQDDGGDQRDAVLLHCLLRQVPDVGRVSLDKIFSAGLTSLEMLERASPGDLNQTTGVRPRLCERICDGVQTYVAESGARRASAPGPSEWLGLLEPLIVRLSEHHGAYRQCVDAELQGGDRAPEKRRHRRGRLYAALRIDALLAEMGEVTLVDELQRLPFDGRLRRLGEFVAALRPAQDAGVPGEAEESPA
ncbi:MAG: hypothetical protein HZB55_11645 [Deltaproteobacteria bacterium]|nr:hypothetical protein [Deltaproteobacteria bacterium]